MSSLWLDCGSCLEKVRHSFHDRDNSSGRVLTCVRTLTKRSGCAAQNAPGAHVAGAIQTCSGQDPAQTALREVADTEALEREYALQKLGKTPATSIRRQQIFASKVHDLVLSRRQQASRLNEEVKRRDQVWRQALTSLRSAEKVVAHIQEKERVEEDRKMRRRSIHRPPATGRWTGLTDPE